MLHLNHLEKVTKPLSVCFFIYKMKIIRITISQDFCMDWINICETLSTVLGNRSALYRLVVIFIISNAITNMKSLMITNQMKSFPPRLGAQCILSSSSMKNSVFCHTHFSFIHPSNIHLSTRDKEINQSQSLTTKKLKSSSVLARSEVSKV